MTPAESVILSWAFEPLPVFGLLLAAILYARGWRKLHRQVPARFPVERLLSFLSGLAVIYIALASPLDAFASWLLIVHMIQHLLLTMIAPPLLLWGWPMLPILSGLPRPLVRDGLGPFLNAPLLHRVGRFFVHPLFAGPLFILSNVVWHVPAMYELALGSPFWHQVEHASFLVTATLFWWPVIQPWPSRPAWPRWAMIPYLLIADLQNTALAAFLSFYDQVLYPTYAAAPRLVGLSALDDQAGAGAVMWVPGSIGFLVPAGVIAMQYLSPRHGRSRPPTPSRPPPSPALARRPLDVFCVPVLGPLLARGPVRMILQAGLFVVALAIIADGLFGPQVASMNLAGVLPWTHWRGLTVLALLVAGNFFCMACPFTFFRDLGRRLLPADRRWPGWLRSKWPALALLVLFFWAYEYFDLWDNPWWTAWMLIGYFVAALAIDGIFKGANFCKSVCPIGQFHFLSSLVSPLEVRVREPSVCASCRTHDCLRGNASQRGCELGLFQPRKSGNMDCTFCLDCVKACPHDNVGLLVASPGADLIEDPARRSSVGAFSTRGDLSAVAGVMIAGAFLNAAAMTRPFEAAMSGLESLASRAVTGWGMTLVFLVALLAAPPLLSGLCTWVGSSLAGIREKRREIRRGFLLTLVPLGFSMWIAHFAFHFLTASHTPLPVFSRVAADLGWGTAPEDWTVPSLAFPELPGWQILLLNAGLLYSLWLLWKKSLRIVPARPFALFLPWACLAAALYVLGIWILFQPMELRGMGM